MKCGSRQSLIEERNVGRGFKDLIIIVEVPDLAPSSFKNSIESLTICYHGYTGEKKGDIVEWEKSPPI